MTWFKVSASRTLRLAVIAAMMARRVMSGGLMGARQFEGVCRFGVIALTYALGYVALLQISDGLWAITAGLRLSCLLLMPYRYWPALVLGESFPMVMEATGYAPHIGWLAADLSAFPPLVLAMPVVWWCRSRLALFPSSRMLNISVLMVCVITCSFVWASASYGILAVVHVPPDAAPFKLELNQFVALFVGQYAGALTMVPIALIAKLGDHQSPLSLRLRRWAASPMILDLVLILPPLLTLLVILGGECNRKYGLICRLAMFLPVVYLTLKHGWRAAAIGCTAVVGALSLMMVSVAQPDVILNQTLTAFAFTCVLLLGSSVSERRAARGLSAWRWMHSASCHDARTLLGRHLRNTLSGCGIDLRFSMRGVMDDRHGDDTPPQITRLGVEAVGHMVRHYQVDQISMRLRYGSTRGKRWVALQTVGTGHGSTRASGLSRCIGESSLDEPGLRALARECRGNLRIHVGHAAVRIGMIIPLQEARILTLASSQLTSRGLLVS